MASELTIQTGVQYEKNGFTAPMAAASTSVTVAGDGFVQNIQDLTAGAAAIEIGNITTLGFASFQNCGNAFIQIGTKDGAGGAVYFARMEVDSPPIQLFIDDSVVTGANVLYAFPEATSGAWDTETAYAVGDIVTSTTLWVCLVAHTSGAGTFADDVAAHPTWWEAYKPLLATIIADR